MARVASALPATCITTRFLSYLLLSPTTTPIISSPHRVCFNQLLPHLHPRRDRILEQDNRLALSDHVNSGGTVAQRSLLSTILLSLLMKHHHACHFLHSHRCLSSSFHRLGCFTAPHVRSVWVRHTPEPPGTVSMGVCMFGPRVSVAMLRVVHGEDRLGS